MTYEEALNYYGEDCCNILKRIFNFCKNNNYIIYQHATNVESANNIIERGFIISDITILEHIPSELYHRTPDSIEYDEEGIKTSIYNGEQCQFGFLGKDELSDTQHFFENTFCDLDFNDLTDPNINRSGFGATCLFVVSKSVDGSREYYQHCIKESYYDDLDEEEVPETCFERKVIPRQLCIGYLDVKNKTFKFNPNFQFNFGVVDEFELGFSSREEMDLSNEIMNQCGRKK